MGGKESSQELLLAENGVGIVPGGVESTLAFAFSELVLAGLDFLYNHSQPGCKLL